MKKLIYNLLIIAVAIATSVNTFANGDSLYSIYLRQAPESKKLILSFENMQANFVQCMILDSRGNIIHRESIDTKVDKAKKFDFTKLKQGHYTFITDDLMKVEKLDIQVTNDEVILKEKVSKTIYKPTVWVNNDKTVDFNLLTLGDKAKVTIEKDGNTYYKESFVNQSSVSKQFNLKTLPSGNYTMVVNVSGQTFYRHIYI